jgi:DNA-binding transcriptional MerR regulator
VKAADLVHQSGIPLATIKYYIREGLLPRGEPTGPRQAEYGPEHLRRLRLIQALTGPADLPLTAVKAILNLIDHPNGTLAAVLGQAIRALNPPTPAASHPAEPQKQPSTQVSAVLAAAGIDTVSDYPAVGRLDQALAAAEDAGFPLSNDRLHAYIQHLTAIAELELADLPTDPGAAVQYAVLGTTLIEPVLLALRLIIHQHLVTTRYGRPGGA